MDAHHQGTPFDPYRLVTVTTKPNGEKTARLHIDGIGADFVMHRINEGPEAITAKHVRAMFGQGWLEPTESDVQTLADALNVMRITVSHQSVTKPVETKAIDTALLALSVELPVLIQHEERYLRDVVSPPYLTKYREENLALFCSLLSQVRQARPLFNAPPKVSVAPWHSDALWLAAFLTMIAGRSGISLKFESVTSRAVVFIEEALEKAGVVSVTRSGKRTGIDAMSISKAFNRRRHGDVPSIATR